ncbi:Putative lipoprotein [Alloalcanivorax dieselolei B5]|uniref:Putative lipoprotein n=1 Tax=Alcanivorax dieselolei (strain DSM 16502 / CGMCC 1.3690 / MCCC 1A00001 / B-5) TaxID=930169 RepID=K0CDK1_ALCDB|nr:PKD domain-containing protein [Alloalcanivorax dieselolei]AFT69651.1 Putative lipoprotein [Alloalcanivorax dieselolei B5]GGK03446.1 hypothetical protein GCM10007426_35530 [Alloalcanivorax dieselolei]
MQCLKTLCALLCASLLLAACGGGGGGGGGDSTPRPIANAGPDQTVEMGTTVTLDGTQSSSPTDGATLSYTWSLASKPVGSTAALSDEAGAQPTFVTDLPGTYEADLVVNDGTADSGHDAVIITATNPDPVAIAETEHHVLIGTTVMLDGNSSVPPTGGDAAQLIYNWHLQDLPTGSTASLAQTGTGLTSFYADVAGTYTAILTVSYQEKTSAPLTVTIVAGNANSKPMADAGGPYTIERGQTLTLDGTGSSDADNDQLSYRWYLMSPGNDAAPAAIWIPNGSELTLDNGLQGHDTASPTLTPDVAGTWTAYLVVHDGTSISNLSSASITVTKPESAENTPPVASFYSKPRVGFIAPVPTDEVELGGTVWSSGSSYDIDGTNIGSSNRRYQWISTPAGYDAEDLTGKGSFSFTPTVEGQYTVEMTVNDGEVDSEPVRRTFIARTGANRAPTPSISVDSQTILVGQTGWFDGSGSTDPDDNALTYHWHLLDKPDGSTAQLRYQNVTRTDGTVLNNARAGIVADQAGVYIVILAVTDSHGVTSNLTSTYYGRILVKSQNNPPVIDSISNDNDHLVNRRRNTHFNDADQPYVIDDGSEPVLLYTQNAVDPDLDTLYYLWTLQQPAGSELPDASVDATFTAGKPLVAGTYTATAIVSDGIDTSEPHSLNFNAVQRADYPSLLLEDYHSAGEINSWDRVTQSGFATGMPGDAPRQRAFPYWDHADNSFPITAFQLVEGDNAIKNYRLTAFGGNYTIIKVHASAPRRSGTEAFSGKFSGLTEGQVIRRGESIDFSLILTAPANADEVMRDVGPDPELPEGAYDPGNALIGMTYTFEIAEKPGWTFEYAPASY